MATLTGQTILSTYQSLLKVGTNVALPVSTLTQITDGVGNNTPMSLSQTSMTIATDITLNGMALGKSGANVGNNTAFGVGCLVNNTASGTKSVAIGYTALSGNTTGGYNIAVGDSAMSNNTTASYNTCISRQGMFYNGTGTRNSTCGYSILFYNTSGSYNQGFGYGALLNNTTGNYNSGLGYYSLYGNTIGNQNTSVGDYSMYSNTTGSNNVAIGHLAGYGPDPGNLANTTGSNNIFIGYLSSGVSGTDSNRTFIGNSLITSTWLAGNLLLGTTTDAGFLINANGTARIVSGLLVSSSTTKDASAIVQFDSTTLGVLFPRMTDAQITAIVSPANGLHVYSTSQNVLCFYDGTSWHKYTHTNL